MLAVTALEYRHRRGLGFPFEKVGTGMLLGSLALMGLAVYAVAQRKKAGLRGARERVYVEHIRLDRGGYESGGRYWGVGEKLYRVSGGSKDLDQYVRAPSAKAARLKVTGSTALLQGARRRRRR